MKPKFVVAIVALAALLSGCGDNKTDPTTTATTPWTGPPPSGPCASLYDESLGSQVLAHTVFSDQGAKHAVPSAELIRYHDKDPERLAKSPLTGDCVRFVLQSEGTYNVYERTPDNYYGQENCFWSGVSGKFTHDSKPYYEVKVLLNFQCAHT